MDARALYLAALKRLARLGYPSGCQKWRAFWAGHRARSRGEPLDVCPYELPTEKERAKGKRAPHLRGAWCCGWGSGSDWYRIIGR